MAAEAAQDNSSVERHNANSNLAAPGRERGAGRRGRSGELQGADVGSPGGRGLRRGRARGGGAGRRGPTGRGLTEPRRRGPREAAGPGRPQLRPPARAPLPPKLLPEPAPAFPQPPASPGAHTHSRTSQLTRTPGNSSSSPRRGAGWARRAAGARRGPDSASALGVQRPRPGRPSSGRAILVSRGRTRRSPSLPALSPRPPPSSFAESQQADSNLGSRRRRRHCRRRRHSQGWGGRRGRGGLGEGRASAGLGAARAHWEDARPAPDTKGAERAAEAPEGSPRSGAPLPGKRARSRQGGAGLRWGDFSSARPHRPLPTRQPYRRRGRAGWSAGAATHRRRVRDAHDGARWRSADTVWALPRPFAWTPSATRSNAPRGRQHSHATAGNCRVVVVVVATKKGKCSHTASIIHPPLPGFLVWALCRGAEA
ncbi:translation initiation factor IF-2-like [Prionailurus viverrinus]|uniref:translation initiation factor IF-2-like n=1 Tax=Prionailurus viverrinus TaxID=61388 RepID=UPI001FF374DB|nr:translation initiation factor IF-2-like [Prionailurus viverrinus]